MPDESEKFSLSQMQANFDIQRVSLGGPIFDVEKLRWLNGCWIREDLSQEQFGERLLGWAFNKPYIDQILPHMQKRVDVLSDFAPASAFLFAGQLPVSASDFDGICKTSQEDIVKHLQFVLWKLEQQRHWERDNLFADLKGLADYFEVKIKEFLAPMFVAIAGTTASISVMDSMVILGPDLARARVRHAVDVLGGVSKKQMKKLEKEFAALSPTV
jgi:glutamyl-tRNA synthetase